jgi:hypothetical protein
MRAIPWESMTLDQKVDRLRQELHGLIGFINNAALVQIESRLAQLTTRVTALENPVHID